MALKNEFGSLLFSSSFWNSLRRISIRLVDFPCEAVWSWISFAGCFYSYYYYELVSLLVISLFKLSIYSWHNFGKLYVSRNLSISSRLSNLLLI